jgi:hypothetical protein
VRRTSARHTGAGYVAVMSRPTLRTPAPPSPAPVEPSSLPAVRGGQATIVVPDIHTANATVHLIDHVMVPPAG